ncbi:MAG: cbb3-type cytochrome c oxidase subunit I [Anaerolineales bacterium]|nr:cbb3-type cytochrome c oxidase subunit I [Anaerolineales bacterium]
MIDSTSSPWRWTWLCALGLFILAGSTGVLMRFGLLSGFPWGLQYTNVRHAHSHLMYFGWVTPALMGLMVAWLPALTGRPLSAQLQTRFRAIIGALLLLAVGAYGAFLLYGYRPAQVGGLRLPLSTILASLNMIGWYIFIAVYRQATKGAARISPLRLWDAALAFLVLASLGAWGVAVTAVLHVQDPLVSAILTHLFLDLFADGWFVLGVLGLASAANPAASRHPWAARSESLLIMGLPVVFLLGIPVNLLPSFVRLIGSLGGLMVGLGLWGQIVVLWQGAEPRWRPALVFLGLEATAVLAVTVPTVARWSERANLRISYLHWLLLGFVTLGLVTAAQATWGREFVRGRRWMVTAVTLLILSLIPLTNVWPAVWHGRWTMQLAAWAALGPVIVASGMLLGPMFSSVKSQEASTLTSTR